MSTVGSRPSWAVACNTMWCIIFEEKASVPSPSLGTCDSGSGSMSAPSQSTNAEGVSPELERWLGAALPDAVDLSLEALAEGLVLPDFAIGNARTRVTATRVGGH